MHAVPEGDRVTISRADLEAMDRDGLVETLVSMDSRLSDMQVVVYETLKPRLDDLEAENEQLRDRVAELEAAVTPNPASKDYRKKSRAEKVFELRVSICRQAMKNRGRAAKDYSDVASVFNDHPSDGHCYQLMKLAADHDAETRRSNYDGFEYESRPSGKNDRLTVTVEDVNDERVLHAVNKDPVDGGGR